MQFDFNDIAIPLIEMLENIDDYKEMDEDDVDFLITNTIKLLVELRLAQNKKIDIFTALALTQQQINKTIEDIMIIEKVDPSYPDYH